MSKKNILFSLMLISFIAFFGVKNNIRNLSDTNHRIYEDFYLTDNTLYITSANDKYKFYNMTIYYKNGEVAFPKQFNPRFGNENKYLSDVKFYDMRLGQLWGFPIKFSSNIEKIIITFFDNVDKTSSRDTVLDKLEKTFIFNNKYFFSTNDTLKFSPYKNFWINGFNNDRTTLIFVANFKNSSMLKKNRILVNNGKQYKIVNVVLDKNRFIQVSLNKPVSNYDDKSFTIL
ncbi:hypothetical protein [Photobacterium damselae]